MSGSLDDIRDYVASRVRGRKFIVMGDGAFPSLPKLHSSELWVPDLFLP